MNRTFAPLLLSAVMALTACGGRFSDSGLNPLSLIGSGSPRQQSLEPKDGYKAQETDLRQGIAQITGARWEALTEGRLLIVTGLAPTKGYWKAELVGQDIDATGRLRPDESGTLRLRFVVWPPVEGSPDARRVATPQVDTITTAITVSNNVLDRMRQAEITGAANSVTIPR